MLSHITFLVILDKVVERMERVVVQQVDDMLDNSNHNQSNGKSNSQSKGQSISKSFLGKGTNGVHQERMPRVNIQSYNKDT